MAHSDPWKEAERIILEQPEYKSDPDFALNLGKFRASLTGKGVCLEGTRPGWIIDDPVLATKDLLKEYRKIRGGEVSGATGN